MTWIPTCLGIDIPALGLRKDTFGHVVITNVGSIGFEQGFAPLCPPMRSMSLFCIGKCEKKAIVDENNEIKVGNVLNMTSTGDHRYGDAAVFLPLMRCVTGFLADPENFDLAACKENPHWSEKMEKKTT